jgi:hypothetical protein
MKHIPVRALSALFGALLIAQTRPTWAADGLPTIGVLWHAANAELKELPNFLMRNRRAFR